MRGYSLEDVAAVVGNSTRGIKTVLEKHYLANDNTIADNVTLLMEKHKKDLFSKPSPNRVVSKMAGTQETEKIA